MNYSWPLNNNFFTLFDRCKVASFFLNKNNRWTQGDLVREFEIKMAKFSNSKYAVFVSSGSTANTILAMFMKDRFYTPQKNVVVLPSVTWQTSCSPWIREGFIPHFVDISLDDLSIDLNKLEEYLKTNSTKVSTIFITSLLGFAPNISKLIYLAAKYPTIKFAMDNCESTLAQYRNYDGFKNLSSFFTSTTSTYFGHQLQSIEGGFLFTNNKIEYEYFLLARNHGMTRSLLGYESQLEDEQRMSISRMSNPYVDPRFDFNVLGNNFRNTEGNALFGLLDLKRAEKYRKHRIDMYSYFSKNINKQVFILPQSSEYKQDVPFSIPIIINSSVFPDTTFIRESAKTWCESNGIETRPIISGNLLRQTAYRQFGNPEDFPMAELLHVSGFYVGLHADVKTKHIDELVKYLNSLTQSK